MSDESEGTPVHPGGWVSSAPQLVVVEAAAFTVTMVIEDRVDDERNDLDYSRDRYEIVGPVGQGVPRYLWLADHTGTLLQHPFDQPPEHLTAKARTALVAWLDWAEDGAA